MIALEQWRRSIGVFAGRGRARCAQKVEPYPSGQRFLFWTDLNCRLFVCALTLCCLSLETSVLSSCLKQPYVNTLALANDIETNPGPTMEEQMTVLTTMINASFQEIRTEMAKMASSIDGLRTSVNGVRDSVTELTDQVRELDRRQETLQLDIDSNHHSICALQDRVAHLDELLEKQEQYSRRENVIFHGIKEDSVEDYSAMRKKVTDLLNRTVKNKVWTEAEIQRAHRLGRPNSSKTRPVIVRFVNFMDKLEVLKARQEFKSLSIGVSNDLTTKQRDELSKLREKGQKGYYRNGKLVVTPLTPEDAMDTTTGQRQRSYINAARRRP